MGKRPKMLASVIREVIAPVLRECPTACGITSISDVEVSEDFSYATVYISALQEEEQALAFLEKRLPQLKKTMGTLYRKKIPELRFRIDPRTQQGGRIDDLLRQAEEGADK